MTKPYIYTITKVKSKKYNIICKLISKIIKKYNPCDIQSKNTKVTCKAGKPCCTGCFYLSDNGCVTNCLGCKLTFCYDLEDDKIVQQVMKLLKRLYILAFINNYIFIRSSEEEILTQINLTKDRSVKYRSIYNAAAIRYFSDPVNRWKLIKWKSKLCQQ